MRDDDEQQRPAELKVRALIVDSRWTHEGVCGWLAAPSDRANLRGAARVSLNDSLPQESGKIHWQWQRGGWLLVDRRTGKVLLVSLSEFDPEFSSVNWFRDYAAYCGISDDGKKSFAVVSQLGRRKPLLKKSLVSSPESAGDICPAPAWNRTPARVTFEPKNEAKFTYTVRSRAVDVVVEDDDQQASDE